MSMHTVFSAECNHALTWQAVALFHSHRASNQPGPITRLLACSPDQLATYRGMDVGPTFVHHNMRFGHPTLVDEKGYPSYNKPASVMFWLREVDPPEEYIALLDTDMLLLTPLDPIALGARPGAVVSAEYSYLVGTEGPFARRFLEPSELGLQAQCGGFHIFHHKDLRRIAPLWLELTRRVRAFAHAHPEVYLSESFLQWDDKRDTVDPQQLAVFRKQAMWQAEMYGYVFGAAIANVSHVVRRDTMLYPGYDTHAGMLPQILHYGSDFTLAVDPTLSPSDSDYRSIYFNKMELTKLDLYEFVHSPSCQSELPLEPFFLPEPPPPTFMRDDKLLTRSGRDLLVIMHYHLLNSALCEFYQSRCSAPIVCPKLMTLRSLNDILEQCVDEDTNCASFARAGECVKNPVWMLAHCPASCGTCDARLHLLPQLLGPSQLIGPNATLHLENATRRVREAVRRRGVQAGLLKLAHSQRCDEVDCLLRAARMSYWLDAPADARLEAREEPRGGQEAVTCERRPSGTTRPEALPEPKRILGGVGSAAFCGLRCLRLSTGLAAVGKGCIARPARSLEGKVAIVERGECNFTTKAAVAQQAGAAAVLIHEPLSASSETAFFMADDGLGVGVSIPVLSVSQHAARQLLYALHTGRLFGGAGTIEWEAQVPLELSEQASVSMSIEAFEWSADELRDSLDIENAPSAIFHLLQHLNYLPAAQQSIFPAISIAVGESEQDEGVRKMATMSMNTTALHCTKWSDSPYSSHEHCDKYMQLISVDAWQWGSAEWDVIHECEAALL